MQFVIHSKHAVRITIANQIRFFRDIFAVHIRNRTKAINTPHGLNAESFGIKQMRVYIGAF
jgi:hypothetical protein